jgi:tetratricopeptide (TPR) repeat protein
MRIIIIAITVSMSLFMAGKIALAWEGSSTGMCSDEYGNNFPCDSGGGGGGSTSGGGGSTSSGSTYSGPSWAEIRQAQRERKGLSLNEKGNGFFEKGDYASAVNYYRQALSYKPDDTVIQDNLRRAEGNLLNAKGNEEYKNGNYAAAADYYQQALDKEPESDVISNNLAGAQQMIQQQQEQQRQDEKMAGIASNVQDTISDIGRDLKPTVAVNAAGQTSGLQFMGPSAQLKSAEFHSQEATKKGSIEGMKEESSKGFDTQGIVKEGLAPLDLKGLPVTKRDPVVPDELRTPKITEFEKKREELRAKRLEMTKNVELLEASPKKDSKKISELKQEITEAQNQENFLNFSIRGELRKAHAIKKENSKN